jgi:hypothetical protein
MPTFDSWVAAFRKGESTVTWEEMYDHANGLLALWGGDQSLTVGEADPDHVVRNLCGAFGDRLYMMLTGCAIEQNDTAFRLSTEAPELLRPGYRNKHRKARTHYRRNGPSLLRRRTGKEPSEFPHPSLVPVLENTGCAAFPGTGHASSSSCGRLLTW